MKLKVLAVCVLLGLVGCKESATESSKAENAQTQPQNVEISTISNQQQVVSGQTESPRRYANTAKRLGINDYVRYDLTQIVPYTAKKQSDIFDILARMVKDGEVKGRLDRCPTNSYYQTAYGFYLQSIGNYREAHKYYEMASEKGNAYAENRLGELYWLGLGVDRDIEKAKYWFERSAKTGYFFAESALGVISLDLPIPIIKRANSSLGGLWFSSSFVQSAKGRMGSNADTELAYYWLKRASLQNDGHSIDMIRDFQLKGLPNQDLEIGKLLNNVESIRIDTPSCSNDTKRPIIIIKENLPNRYVRYRSESLTRFSEELQRPVPTLPSYSQMKMREFAREMSKEVFLGDKVVVRGLSPEEIQQLEEEEKQRETEVVFYREAGSRIYREPAQK